MQTVAQAYLILFPLHGTGIDVAIATSLQFVPMLLLGPFGGLVADRYDKRRVLYATQASAGLLALILGLLAATGSVQLWQVYVLAAGLGIVNLFDNPARQTFVFELVGPELLPNAISLNSVLINGARVIGPAIGGVLIVTVGVATCFMVNAGSYVAVITALAMMDASRLNRRPGVVRAKGQIREGLRYAWGTRELRDTLLAMADGRCVRLQLHGDAALVGEIHVPRRRRSGQRLHGRHGGRGGRRWPLHGLPEPPLDEAPRLHRPRVRCEHPRRGGLSERARRYRDARRDGCRGNLVRRHEQRHAPTSR